MEKIQIPDLTSKIMVLTSRQASPDLLIHVGNGCCLTLVHWITGNIKFNLNINISGTHSEVVYIGLIVGDGHEIIEVNTVQKHLSKDSKSTVLLKSVLKDSAHLTFNGRIYVEKNASGTDAYQRNDNLLTGRDCQVYSRPVLEILTGDLRCTHGTTTGHINPEELWYLENRGIKQKQAVEIISAGFLSSAIEKYCQNQKVNQIYRKIEEVFGHQ
jgi:Fe-S cluster assembly protein SufD